MSVSFIDTSLNVDGLSPRPHKLPDDSCVHHDVTGEGEANTFSNERLHPVWPVRLPANAISMSVGELSPNTSSGNHRHAYESMIYVLEGEGYSIMEGRRFEWRAGDAFYTPPWCWHQHHAGAKRVRYLTATNMPLLEKMGQTVMRQEERSPR